MHNFSHYHVIIKRFPNLLLLLMLICTNDYMFQIRSNLKKDTMTNFEITIEIRAIMLLHRMLFLKQRHICCRKTQKVRDHSIFMVRYQNDK